MQLKSVGIFGSSELESQENIKLATRLGESLANLGVLIITGGSTGISEAVAKSALANGGKVVCFLPEYQMAINSNTISVLPEAYSFFLPEGGFKSRNMLSVANSKVAIFIEGKWGTLNELTLAVEFGTPSIVFSRTGGICSVVSEICKSIRSQNNIYLVTELEEALNIICSILRI